MGTQTLPVALSVRAKRRKQPKYALTDQWILETVVHPQNGILFVRKM